MMEAAPDRGGVEVEVEVGVDEVLRRTRDAAADLTVCKSALIETRLEERETLAVAVAVVVVAGEAERFFSEANMVE
jgi:hypothetical protein